jgi:hypothetical protein
VTPPRHRDTLKSVAAFSEAMRAHVGVDDTVTHEAPYVVVAAARR